MKINFIDLQAQYRHYKEEIDREIHEVLDTSGYIMGPKVKELEENLAGFAGVKHAIACSSGTDALTLSLMSIGIKPGDEIITTPFTFIATAESIAFLGAKPVFADIDAKTYNIDTALIEEKITAKTKAVIPVSLFGQVSDMDTVNAIAKRHGLKVIEDAAQSFGATYKGKRSCGLSDLACTSFFPAKPLGCYGDGGAVFTDDDDIAKKLRVILNHGQTKRYVHTEIGMNGRLDAIQAAVLKVKLKYFNEEIKKRVRIADKYSRGLKNITPPYVSSDCRSVWAQYCIRTGNREEMLKKCSDNGIPTGIYYPIPLHLQKVFEHLGHKEGDFPVSEQASKEIMALPMSAFLTDEEQNYIINTING